MASDDARGELLDRLLEEPLDRFVERRNALARERRTAGDREAATWLASLRRPAPAAWALDRAAHADPEAVGSLLDLGTELRDVQDRAVHGDRDAAGELHRLSARVQRAVDGISRRAAELMRDAGHGVSTDAMLQMAATLRAALGNEELRGQLASGRLLSLAGASGFSFGVEPSALVQLHRERPDDDDAAATPRSRAGAGSAGTPRGAAHADADDEAERQRVEAERRLRERRARADAAARAADDADREVFQRQSEAEQAQQEVSDLRTRIRALQDDLGAAEGQARSAALAVRDAVERAREVRRDADRAQAALPDD